jgi:membrane-associated phospholipid phosphatase
MVADGWRARRVVERLPRAVLEMLELAYLGVSVMVPAGFALVFFLVPDLDPDRYWTVVVSAELGCYACLPWFQTRTPAALGSGTAITRRPIRLRRANAAMLKRVSIGANTFPSGHAAGAVATALVVGEVLPAAGVGFMVWAVGIMAGSVIGRYHYLPDALAGAALAFAVWVL